MEKKQSINNKKNDAVSWVRGKFIGKGSFGTVNLAFNKSNGAVFAVKSVGFSSGGSNQIEALENEIRILRSVSSPYIIQYLNDDVSYESSTHNRNLHLQYLPGGTVADVAPDVDENTVRSYTWCIVSALNYLHSRGIVHCDVKGKNVLVAGSGQAKLADFGSAAEVKPGAPIMPRGSPLWMAPEVLRGESQGPESDVWSLGCTVIEMITGKSAWEDKGIDTLSRIGFSGSVPEMPIGLSELGRDFLSKCLKREPSQRWSCDQLLRHPFISSGSPIMVAESSPRCVLDWFSDYDENDDVEMELGDEDWARDRIGKLAITGGVNWESEGWVVVRGSEKEQEGTTSVYSELLVSNEAAETAGKSSEYSDSVEVELRAEWEFWNSGGRDTSREECCGSGDKWGSGGLR